eukprot:TRINITY_DN2311_c0_g1_i3.p1 TRINITY_DN2311_c0_g1~~TRINITY_DN2311_c0_g1_i3.p1  ORF type:complete len:253 (+),score=46.49 TRINITY_DN2311_c0_g1_i3:179-937(+)
MDPDTLRTSVVIPTAQTTLSSFLELLDSAYSEDGASGSAHQQADEGGVLDISLRSSAIERLGDCEKQEALIKVHELMEMLPLFEVLIERYLDDEERLMQIFEVYSVLSQVRDKYGRYMSADAASERTPSGAGEAGTGEVVEEERHNPVPPPEGTSPTDLLECPICIDEFEYDAMYSFAECRHTYCTECLGEYLGSKIAEADVLDIRCPDPSCNTPVLAQHIARLVDPGTMAKYERFSLIATLKADPSARWCP